MRLFRWKWLRSILVACLLSLTPFSMAGSQMASADSFRLSVEDSIEERVENDSEEKTEQPNMTALTVHWPSNILASLHWQNTLDYIASHPEIYGMDLPLAYQLAIASVEEAFQDEFDRLLDDQHRDILLAKQQQASVEAINQQARARLLSCQKVKQAKIRQIQRRFLSS